MPLPANISDAPFIIGEEIAGRYAIERAIAEGGMGLVFAARHADLDELVAIKFLKPEFARQPEIIGRFAREAKACTKIKSEYVAKVLDVGVNPTRGPYIVMEYLEGEDLSELLARDGKLPPERAVELILQCCEALAQAHALGIIHRDIKPENLFVVKNESAVPTLKVLDFGVSKTALTGKIFGNELSVAKTQSLLGTPLYMSPEQLRGKIDIDPDSEVWAVGAVLYELVTGEAPFTGNTVTEVCASVLETIPRPPIERAPQVMPELQAVIMKCLEKTPTNRYKTIAELAVALQPFGPKRSRMAVERAIEAAKAAGQVASTLTSVPSMAPPSAPSSTKTPFPLANTLGGAGAPSFAPAQQNRTKQFLIGGAVVLLLGVAGISFAMRGSTPSTPPPAAAAAVPTATEAPTNTPAPPPEKAAVVESAPTAPTGAAIPSGLPAPAFRSNVPVPVAQPMFRGPARPSAIAAPSAPKAPTASAPGAPSAPAPPSAPTNNAKSSAIDDRK